ncbi:PRD domain-containing protein [Clostridium sp.]|uniref:BglG family transcription antiterminator n=1 Tax=Clostridium sp. TaxID=1506 RepID=UPI001A6407F6|nr:PRD domain-containing protein [Clostridium sp.]MBK5235267.1 PRD domain-containing protein [Clostridium sp.]
MEVKLLEIETSDFNVIKVFNDNIVLVYQAHIVKILYEKGIGFGKHEGDTISKDTSIEKIFSIENKINHDNFYKLINSVEVDLIALCEEIIYMISTELNEDLQEKIHISLIDHITVTLKRIQNVENNENLLLVETETLFPRAFELAKKAATMIEDKTKVHLSDDEIGFIALHIQVARNDDGVYNSKKYRFVLNTIIEIIENELNITIDKKSLEYDRFITHIQFAIQRISNNTPIKNELLDTIREKYPSSFKMAQKISKFVEGELGLKVIEDETAYLARHIHKFKKYELKKDVLHK